MCSPFETVFNEFVILGINSTLEDWRTFLTQTLTGALAAPHDLFRKV